MKDSKSMQLWNILYPVFLYFAATTAVLYVLGLLLPKSMDSKLLRQLITSAAVLPLLYRDYRQGRKARQPGRPLFLPGFALAFFTGGCFAVAFNNVLGQIRIADYSASYGQIEQAFYMGSLLLEITALCIVIPLAEELLYRGIVYGRAKEWLGVKPGIILSALIFGLIHMNLVQFVYASVFGVLLACFAEWQEGIGYALAAHMAANLTSVLRAETGIFAFMEQNTSARAGLTVLLLCMGAAGIWAIRKECTQKSR